MQLSCVLAPCSWNGKALRPSAPPGHVRASRCCFSSVRSLAGYLGYVSTSARVFLLLTFRTDNYRFGGIVTNHDDDDDALGKVDESESSAEPYQMLLLAFTTSRISGRTNCRELQGVRTRLKRLRRDNIDNSPNTASTARAAPQASPGPPRTCWGVSIQRNAVLGRFDFSIASQRRHQALLGAVPGLLRDAVVGVLRISH